jgi:hypothetical protein
MISHKHKFVFVHINKTGGTSIETILRKISKNWNGKHHLIEKYRKLADEKHGFENYFKFTFVRNPWDRLLSNYFFRKITLKDNRVQDLSFKNWIINSRDGNYSFENCLSRRTQLDWIVDENGEVVVDFIGRFENLQQDFNIICDKIKIPQQQLPHANKSKHTHYTEYYDDETRQIVAEKYAKDIEYFGYKFGK